MLDPNFDFDNIVTLEEGRTKGLSVSSSITLMLTPEQNEEYKANKDKDSPLFYLGFIPPNQIISYSCEKCGKSEGAVNVRISITQLSKDPVAYVCYECEKGHSVYHYMTTKDLDIIPVDLIEWDDTGDYKTPTPESIEKLMEKIELNALAGTYTGLESCIEHLHDLKIARKWAEKIGYEINQERLDNLETTRKKSYIKNFNKNLPKFLRNIKEYYSHAFSLIEINGYSIYESRGLGEILGELFEMLPHLNITKFTDETKIDIIRILHLYHLMHVEKKNSLQEEKEELEKKINELEAEIIGSRSFVIEYERKFELTKEQRNKAEEEAKTAYTF